VVIQSKYEQLLLISAAQQLNREQELLVLNGAPQDFV
jgi:hypothetical protein